MEIKIFQTGYGSHSLYLLNIRESYHSFHGALKEANHVYIHSGVDDYASNFEGQIHVFELGFGLGLNALLAWQRAGKKKAGGHFYYH